MKRFILRIALLMYAVLAILAPPAQAQSIDARWQRAQTRAAAMLKDAGFVFEGHTPFRANAPFSSLFRYGTTDPMETIDLPQYRRDSERGIIREGTKSFTVSNPRYQIYASPSKKTNVQSYFSHYVETFENSFADESQLRRRHPVLIDGQFGFKGYRIPLIAETQDITYGGLPGMLLTKRIKGDWFMLIGLIQPSFDPGLYASKYTDRLKEFTAMFALPVSDDDVFIVNFNAQHGSVTGLEPALVSTAVINQVMNSLAAILAEEFGTDMPLDRELSREAYSQIKQAWADLAARAPARFPISEYKQGYVGKAIALMGDVVHDPGRGSPVKMKRGTAASADRKS